MSLRRLAHRLFGHHLRHHHHHDPFYHWHQPQALTSVFDRDPFFRTAPQVFTVIDAEPQGHRGRRDRYYANAASRQQQQQQQQQHQQEMEQQEQQYRSDNTTTTNSTKNAQSNINGERNIAQQHREHQQHRGLSRRRHHQGWAHPAWHHHHPLSFFSPFSSLFNSPTLATVPEMTIDMFSSPKEYTIHAAVPGIDKNDIQITVEDGILNIEAERKEERKERRSNDNKKDPEESTELKANIQEPSAATATTTAASSTTATPSESTTAENKADTTTGTTTATSTTDDVDADVDADEAYDYIESTYGRVQRSFTLPEDVDVNGLTAKYEDGLIKITLPRITQQKVDKRQKIVIQ